MTPTPSTIARGLSSAQKTLFTEWREGWARFDPPEGWAEQFPEGTLEYRKSGKHLSFRLSDLGAQVRAILEQEAAHAEQE